MADWVPVNPYRAPILPLPDEALQEEAWQEGVDAMARAIVEEMDRRDPWMIHHADWQAIKRELGLG